MKQGYVDITVVLDESGSMGTYFNDTCGGFNKLVEDQKRNLPPGAKARLTLVKFNNYVNTVFSGAPIHEVVNLGSDNYRPSGGTALFDAIGTAIESTGERLRLLPESERPSQVLFVIQTDGEENASRIFSRNQVFDKIDHQRNKYSWEFVFMGADQDAIRSAASIGIRSTHTMAYASADTKGAFEKLSRSVTSYASAGTAQVGAFFDDQNGQPVAPTPVAKTVTSTSTPDSPKP